MKKTLLMATLIAGGLWVGDVAVNAQGTSTNTPAVVARPPLRTGLETLGLTPEQKAKAEPIVLDMRKQWTEVRTNTAVAAADKRVKFKEIHDAAAAKLKDILTPEQMAKWERQTAGPRRPEGANHPVTPATPAAPKN